MTVILNGWKKKDLSKRFGENSESDGYRQKASPPILHLIRNSFDGLSEAIPTILWSKGIPCLALDPRTLVYSNKIKKLLREEIENQFRRLFRLFHVGAVAGAGEDFQFAAIRN